MPEKRHSEKMKPLPEIEISVSEILAINGRSFEPYIKTFRYNGENVATNALGTLVGVFEVAERNEDSAYIVNFLASIAKKEYFINPRRGAVESFEAALHKINVALAELVKHGNVSWLGKLHGVIGVFEKNNFHFSATGDGSILLFRNDTLSNIAEGLASEESSLHPIKTFVEVSSGRLSANDKIVLTSPELFRLFSFEDLRKNALRMDADRFKQCLQTALINELDIAGTIIVDLSEKPAISSSKPIRKKEPETEPPTTLKNVFSNAAFIQKTPKQKFLETSPAIKEPVNEYIDSKTGHIYVQGDTPQEPAAHPFLERASFFLQDTVSVYGTFLNSQKKWFRKARKQSVITLGVIGGEAKTALRTIARSMRRQWKRLRAEQKTLSAPAPSERSVVDNPTPQIIAPQNTEEEFPPFLKEKLATFYNKQRETSPIIQKAKTVVPDQSIQHFSWRLTLKKILCFFKNSFTLFKKWAGFGIQSIHIIIHESLSFYRQLEPPAKKIVLSGILGILVITGGVFVFLINQPTSTQETTLGPVTETPSLSEAFFIDQEKNAHQITKVTELFSGNNFVTGITLGNDMFLVTKDSIIDPRENTFYPLPKENGSAVFATGMDDLRMVFIAMENGALFAWSPLSKTFVRNDIALPENVRIRALGTYLTYLYVLDDETDQIYRFPRAEGGFGTPVKWLRDSLTIHDRASFAVSENIFLAPDAASVHIFSRGRETGTFELLQTPLDIQILYTKPELRQVYVLDSKKNRVLIFTQDGALVAQYFSERFTNALALSADEKTGEVFVLTPETFFSFHTEQKP